MRKSENKFSKVVFIDLYVNQKKSGLEIARFFGIGRTTVGRWIERYGLEPRDISEVRKNKKWSPSAIQKQKLSILGKSQVGNKNPTWKGGISITKEGYRLIRRDNHYVKEHRCVMEQKLGRKLDPSEKVHHIDGDRLNNDISNLELLSNVEHTKKHWTEQRKKEHSLRIKEIRSKKYWSTR
jgi:transposase